MLKLINFIKTLQFIFRPSYWIMVHKYDREVDELVKNLLERYDYTEAGPHIATLGPIKMWVSNRPYGSQVPIGAEGRPSRLTILLGEKKLNAAKRLKEDIL